MVYQVSTITITIKQKGILFNTGAETYITKLINNFNTDIYLLVSLLLIDTVNKKATPFSFSKIIIIYIIDTKEEIYILNFNKVQYLLNYGINIFGAKKPLNRSDI